MGIMKLKPVRTPRLLDEWAEEKAVVRKDAARDAQLAIEHSKKLVAQAKEIEAKIQRLPKKPAKRNAG
jgi:hypothetical protein